MSMFDPVALFKGWLDQHSSADVSSVVQQLNPDEQAKLQVINPVYQTSSAQGVFPGESSGLFNIAGQSDRGGGFAVPPGGSSVTGFTPINVNDISSRNNSSISPQGGGFLNFLQNILNGSFLAVGAPNTISAAEGHGIYQGGSFTGLSGSVNPYQQGGFTQPSNSYVGSGFGFNFTTIIVVLLLILLVKFVLKEL